MIRSGFSMVNKEDKFLFSFKDKSFFVNNPCCCTTRNGRIKIFMSN